MASRNSKPCIAAIFEITILWIIWRTFPNLRQEKEAQCRYFLALSMGFSTVKFSLDLQFIIKWENFCRGECFTLHRDQMLVKTLTFIHSLIT